jgi:TRAP transporter TAXI family solute receptor
MKGKKVAKTPGTPLTTKATLCFLAFGGLTEKDVEQVVVSGTSGAYDALIDGTLDGAYMPFEGASSYTLESSPRGLRWLEMDPNDAEGWARLQKLMPYGPYLSKTGAGCSEDNPVQGAGYNMGFFLFKDGNPDIAYEISKAIYEGYDYYKDMSADLVYWDEAMLLNYEKQIFPMHEGTVRFLKEIGKWTPDLENWQTWKVKQEEGRINAWPKFLKDTQDKNIQPGSEEFLIMWEEYLWQNDLMSTPSKAPIL